MKKRICVMLALGLCVGLLAACGGKENKDAASATSKSASSAVSEADAEEKDAEKPEEAEEQEETETSSASSATSATEETEEVSTEPEGEIESSLAQYDEKEYPDVPDGDWVDPNDPSVTAKIEKNADGLYSVLITNGGTKEEKELACTWDADNQVLLYGDHKDGEEALTNVLAYYGQYLVWTDDREENDWIEAFERAEDFAEKSEAAAAETEEEVSEFAVSEAGEENTEDAGEATE